MVSVYVVFINLADRLMLSYLSRLVTTHTKKLDQIFEWMGETYPESFSYLLIDVAPPKLKSIISTKIFPDESPLKVKKLLTFQVSNIFSIIS
jgi:hypothetical protein